MGCRLIIRLLIAAVAIEFTAPIFAGELGEFLSSIARDSKRRNCWPEPFVYPDRQLARQAMAIQVTAGWERQNLLSEFHFTPDGKELTEGGRMRVQWIMSEASEPHRQVYVRRANSPQETAVRMQAVQRFVAQSAYASNVPVLESTRSDDGWPADRIDTVSRKAATSILEPKLMNGGVSGGGSGGGSSGH
jgi:hypothetical protein